MTPFLQLGETSTGVVQQQLEIKTTKTMVLSAKAYVSENVKAMKNRNKSLFGF